MNFEQQKLQRSLERQALLERQVARCTIRAPHDGFVIYANDSDRDVSIEPGISVRQKQDLFFLPDLNRMEVVAMIHESVVSDVAAGMPARVVVEGLPRYRLEGHVASMTQIPVFNRRTADIRNFPTIVKLDQVPPGLRPGMTAEVEIALTRRENVLAVPPEAVGSEDGQKVCYVAREEGLERREVKVGHGTSDLVEILDGLAENEEVVLNPPEEMRTLEARFLQPSPSTPDEAEGAGTIQATAAMQ